MGMPSGVWRGGGAEGGGAEGGGADGDGAEGVGADGDDAEGGGADGIGAEEVGADGGVWEEIGLGVSPKGTAPTDERGLGADASGDTRTEGVGSQGMAAKSGRTLIGCSPAPGRDRVEVDAGAEAGC